LLLVFVFFDPGLQWRPKFFSRFLGNS
jgi:hypothetical protein